VKLSEYIGNGYEIFGELGGLQPRPWPLVAVPNVTAHPSTASVPIAVFLYNGPLLCGFNVAIKMLKVPLAKIEAVAVTLNCVNCRLVPLFMYVHNAGWNVRDDAVRLVFWRTQRRHYSTL